MGSNRYIYTEFTSYDFARSLKKIGLTDGAFARLWRVRSVGKVAGWRTGKESIPPWVAVACAIMEAHPGNVVTLRDIAADTIIEDTRRPELGQYPFLGDTEEGDEDNAGNRYWED